MLLSVNDTIGDDKEYCPTTIDNPWNPFTQFDAWYAYDTGAGYNTLIRWARMMRVMAEAERVDDPDLVANDAIDELIRLDPLNLYVKAAKDTNCKEFSMKSPIFD